MTVAINVYVLIVVLAVIFGMLIALGIGWNRAKKELLNIRISKMVKSEEITLEELRNRIEPIWLEQSILECQNGASPNDIIPVTDGMVELLCPCTVKDASECGNFPDRCEDAGGIFIGEQRYCTMKLNLNKLCNVEYNTDKNLLTSSEIDQLADALVKHGRQQS